jgi:hypothetical protein
MNYISGALSEIENDFSINTKSSVKSKHDEFINLLLTMAKSIQTNEAVTFPSFPGQPVTPEHPSFYMFAQYSLDQLDQQLQFLLKAEETKTQLDQRLYQMFA